MCVTQKSTPVAQIILTKGLLAGIIQVQKVSMTVRTRMAPSPTGEYHVGHIATLLKNYAWAKHNHGQFILRIEDTDQERKVEGAVERIMDVITRYGLSWDEGPDIGGPYAPYIQSERLELYKTFAEQLVIDGKAYHCFCSKERMEAVRAEQVANHRQPRYDRHCRQLSPEEVSEKLARGESSVIRLKVPDSETITFTDLVRGQITIQSDEIDDRVLLKSDGFPTYHLAVVIDDNAMKITDIMRGEEWISSTPVHVLLYQAFGWELPVYAHIPVFLNPDGKGKMSKRKGTVSAVSFLENGYLPEALLNFFMILGWSPKDQREIITLDEYIREFDPKDISAKSVVFDMQKLAWINGIYIRQLSNEALFERLKPFIPVGYDPKKVLQLLPLVKERLVTLADIAPLLSYFFQDIVVAPESLVVKGATPELVQEQLEYTHSVLHSLTDWSVESLENSLRAVVGEKGWKPKQYFMMLRLATTGQTATPPLFDTLAALGKEIVLARLQLR